MSDAREALAALIQERILDEGANECSCGEWEHWEDPYQERIATHSGHVADAILAAGWTPPGERVKPSVEDVARALAELNEDTDWEGGVESYLPDARAVLALLPGRTETEVKAEALREAAETVPGSTSDDPIDPYDRVAEWLIDRANRIEKEADDDR